MCNHFVIKAHINITPYSLFRYISGVHICTPHVDKIMYLAMSYYSFSYGNVFHVGTILYTQCVVSSMSLMSSSALSCHM